MYCNTIPEELKVLSYSVSKSTDYNNFLGSYADLTLTHSFASECINWNSWYSSL